LWLRSCRCSAGGQRALLEGQQVIIIQEAALLHALLSAAAGGRGLRQAPCWLLRGPVHAAAASHRGGLAPGAHAWPASAARIAAGAAGAGCCSCSRTMRSACATDAMRSVSHQNISMAVVQGT
jgi:hypothetical protein